MNFNSSMLLTHFQEAIDKEKMRRRTGKEIIEMKHKYEKIIKLMPNSQ